MHSLMILGLNPCLQPHRLSIPLPALEIKCTIGFRFSFTLWTMFFICFAICTSRLILLSIIQIL
ncbi:unnamed protein product [Moneuplotes crassus]|uniref:Uncharacterized protein n=1 Tax=Euplotes crassus TaxID=5936 RepID=A0AAD2D7J0_EUPCR|nr:unnamed protein product [Moneuplotes crassus]